MMMGSLPYSSVWLVTVETLNSCECSSTNFVILWLKPFSNNIIHHISSAFANSSALRCFKRRIAYANTSFDRILSSSGLLFSLLYCNSFETLTSLLYIDLVGWSTSSIRRRSELPKVINNLSVFSIILVCYAESVVSYLIFSASTRSSQREVSSHCER